MHDEDLPASPVLESGAGKTATRRQWVAAAGGGLALAASGLVLPGWLEEAEARDGAYGGGLGGRHGKNRRGVDKAKRRDKGERRDKKHDGRGNGRGGARPGSGALHVHWVKFYVYNDRPVTTPNQSAAVRGWGNMNGEPDPWDRLPLVSVANGTYTGEFEMFEYTQGAIVIDDHFYVEADNSTIFVPVAVRLYYGGTMTADGYQGGTQVEDAWFLKEDQQKTWTMDGRLFTIKRLYDTDDYNVFDIHFT